MFDKSFYLTRTNPKLTGNIKIVVSTDGKIYLESYDANKVLSADRFKHFEVKKEEYYKEVVPLFFRDVENNSIFGNKKINDISDTYDDYAFQFDDTYYSGAQFTQDTWYKEEYEYVAPLYINKKSLPDSFIVMRVNGAGSLTQRSDSSHFRSDIIDEWRFVKHFDLKETSIFGNWMKRNFVDDIGLPNYPLLIEHGDIDLSNVSGIDIKKGGWVNKSLTLKDALSDNSPIFRTEEFFTDLWQDNEIIYPEIVNIKFLFDDEPATPTELKKYTINRYLGFYTNEEQIIKSVSPFKGFDLNKTSFDKLEELTFIEISQIPFLRDNLFIQEIDNRVYSFDPIKNGWQVGKNYWVEWKGNHFRLERIKNNNTNLFDPNQIIGEYIYRVISSEIIKWEINEPHFIHKDSIQLDSNSTPIVEVITKVLINELSTDKNTISIKNQIKFNSRIVNNIIENNNTTYTTLKRIFEQVEISGQTKYMFRIILDNTIDNNLFEIENFNESDLHLMKIDEEYHVIKKYDETDSNVPDKYYLYTDRAIDVNSVYINTWINNGNITKDSKYLYNREIENITINETTPFFDIMRIDFTDIKDFDFDRVETDYTKSEYEKEYEINPTLEPKLFAKEWREIDMFINTIGSDRARRIPKTDTNNRPVNIRTNDPISGLLYEDTDLYYKDTDGKWMMFEGEYENETFLNYKEDYINLKRDFYREEGYIWRLEDDDDNLISEIDFLSGSNPNKIYEELIWGIDGLSEYSTSTIDLPTLKGKNPNISIDTNYTPVSSEYITSDELWEIRNNTLTSIWDKNQTVCKWGFLNSIGRQDLPYRLNYSLEIGFDNNREPNPNTANSFPERNEFNLDYFYRFGLKDSDTYLNHTLHLSDDYFNIDDYYSQEFDYFEYLFNSDAITSDGYKPFKKYSMFNARNIYNDPFTTFKGIKYHLLDVDEIVFDEEELEENSEKFVDDIITSPNPKYDGYKFSIIFGKKLSTFTNNPGNGNSNFGIDIYLNDKWKNVVIHIYINTDETIQLVDSITKNLINAETSTIDKWYLDNLERQEIDSTKWLESEFKINNFGIGLRPRDMMLWEFINILDNYNFDPNDSNREIIKFIHIYEDGTSKEMDYTNSDFIIDTDQADELVIKEEAYMVSAIDSDDIPSFEINNSVKYRIVEDDDINSSSNDPKFTSDGIRVNSINDINSYNEYPIAKTITDNILDSRKYWELEDQTDPSLFRHNGAYVPIFKDMNLFRPYGYKHLKDQNIKPILPNGNWKFYDSNSDVSEPSVRSFGIIDEIVYSKVNVTSNILKIDDPQNREKSVYPMVDEYGYDYDSRYLFASNWEQEFYYESKEINVPINDIVGVAGYSVRYDGIEDYLRLPDHTKFNLETFIIDEANFNNYIDIEPEGEKSSQQILVSNIGKGFDFIFVSSSPVYSYILNVLDDDISFIEADLLVDTTYELRIKLLSHTLKDGSPSTNSISVGTIIEVPNDPNKPEQIGEKYLLLTETEQPYTPYDVDTTIGDVTIGSNAYVVGSDNYVLQFNTSKYHDKITSDGTTIYGSLTQYDLPPTYYNGTTVPVKIYIGLYSNDTNNVDIDDIINIELTFNIKDSLDNFIDIDTGNELIENNSESEFGDVLLDGYFKKDDELGNILNYKYDAKISESDNYTDIQLDTDFPLWKEYAGIETPRPGRIGVDPFSYNVPRNWNDQQYYDIMNKIIPLSGDSLKTTIDDDGLFSGIALYHYLEYGSQDKSTIFDPPRSNDYENFKFGNIVIENEFYKMSGIKNSLNSPTYRGFEISNQNTDNTINAGFKSLVSPMRISNSDPFTFEPDYKTMIQDSKCIVYVGESSGGLSTPTYTFRWYKTYREENISFKIIPSNSSEFILNIPIRQDGSEFGKLGSVLVLNSINNKLPTDYVATILTDNNSYTEYKIAHVLTGKYFNFDIELLTLLDLRFISKEESELSKSVTSKMCKTSLKDESIRQTGYKKDISVEFYVNVAPESWSKQYETILYKGADTTEDIWQDQDFYDFTFAIGKFDTTDKLVFRTCHQQLDGDYTHNNLISSFEINDGIQHHICCVFDLENRSKRIYIDGVLDSENRDFLEPTDTNDVIVDDTPDERELVSQFLDNRQRFLPGPIYNELGIDTVLANKIRLGLQDSNTLYWYDVIRGIIPIRKYDQRWQYENWALDITTAYNTFKENYISLDYYIKTSTDNTWDLLIATDSVTTLGQRNFEGYIDELRIWNYVRSAQQIKDNYRFILRPEAYPNPLETMISYIRFDEGKGVTEVNDSMDGYVVKEMDRWSKIETSFINDGNTEQEVDSRSYFNFERSYYDATKITILEPDDVDWDISDIDLIGFSDERNAVASTPLISTSSKVITKPIFKRTKAMDRKIKKKKQRMNIKKKVIKFTKPRSTKPSFTLWWKLKSLASRKLNFKVKTFKVKLRIRKKGKGWLKKVRLSIRKRRW